MNKPDRKESGGMERECILILDFGSQYTQLIARRIREAGVYSEIVDSAMTMEEISSFSPTGLIFSGSPASVHDNDPPVFDPAVFDLKLPVLGICYGLQCVVHHFSGSIRRSGSREYGAADLRLEVPGDPLFDGLPENFRVWMSHADEVQEGGLAMTVLAGSESVPVAAAYIPELNFRGLQFHPEVVHTEYGSKILANFALLVCGCRGNWTPRSYIDETLEGIQNRVGNRQVVCGLSGGVDSAVTAALLHRAIGDQLTCIFVDNGLLRHEEAERLFKVFKENLQMKIIRVDAVQQFLDALAGIVDPEEKRRRVGHVFIDVFAESAASLADVGFLAQGTLYPDVIESSGIGKHAQVIKSHHNVGGLPEKLDFELLEPLRLLFKDEARLVGLELGLPEDMVWRQPFPGPGLAVRVAGEVTEERLELLRRADRIVQQEMKRAGWYRKVWQSFAVLLPVRSVGVMGDGRTYEFTIALRVVESADGMTADWVQLPRPLIGRISTRIINEVRGVNRVVYDVTSKPPGTIEWE